MLHRVLASALCCIAALLAEIIAAGPIITFKPPLDQCDALKRATKPDELNCPAAANEKAFYECVQGKFKSDAERKVYARGDGFPGRHVISGTPNGYIETHGLRCTTTSYWEAQPCVLSAEALKFPIMGDWGGKESAPPSAMAAEEIAKKDDVDGETAIASNDIKAEMAKLLIALHAQRKFDFVLNVGDNVYDNGIRSSATQVQQFQTIFKEYGSLPLLWYCMLGNHDYKTKGSPELEISYTTVDGTGRWILPEPFYTFTYKLKDPEAKLKDTIVHFIVIDTQLLCSKGSKAPWKALKGPRVFPNDPGAQKASNDHLAWVHKQLASKTSQTADYLFVIGHYQVYSVRKKHDNFDCMLEFLHPDILGDKYDVTAYISGHQHLLQHFKAKSAKGRLVDYVLSGEGSDIDVITADDLNVSPKAYQRIFFHGRQQKNDKTKPGLIHVEVGPEKATFYYVDADKKSLREPMSIARRKHA